MNWSECRRVMERDVIKTDNMASEDAYFLATHMPFPDLEIYQGGRVSSTPVHMTEDEVFDRLICNPDQEHRMIIVRGDNGTGKSHLIRYFKARLEHSPLYNPDTEQIVFVRRLNNSVRGVFQQLLDQDVIRDPDVSEKVAKFVSSSESGDEQTLKSRILYAYAAAVENDQEFASSAPDRPENITSYLLDPRVREHLLRDGGPISKCYSLITAPSDEVLKASSIFSEDDFTSRSVNRSVRRDANADARTFVTLLKSDRSCAAKAASYLNRFTRNVVQSCADISSENTRSIFEQLRKDLKLQGKRLTLFIEDFTGFTGIDSELITVLSTEHGGDYEDLCPVTSVIGITNDYYDQFRDNFTDRVTHQISLTAGSFSSRDFLVQLTARYLNAVYTDPDRLREWYTEGAEMSQLPVSGFVPPCRWETVPVEGKEVTLYPFNSNAVECLFDQLPTKSPRNFLRRVLGGQMQAYFDGKTYDDEWQFPLNPANAAMANMQHASSIDLLDMPSEDRERLKSVLALWGNGTAFRTTDSSGDVLIGGVSQGFLADIRLGAYTGIADGKPADPGPSNPGGDGGDTVSPPPPPKPEPDREYRRRFQALNDWFSKGAALSYHQDFRQYLRDFLLGSGGSVGAINWQDAGVPAFIASSRLSSLDAFYIEGQEMTDNAGRAVIRIERNAESRDALLALLQRRYEGSWDFQGSVFYQQRLAVWLERSRDSIIQNVCPQIPVLEWAMAAEYLRRVILGVPVEDDTPLKTAESLLHPMDAEKCIPAEKRITKEWRELIQFVQGHALEFDNSYRLLQMYPRTVMGNVMRFGSSSDKQIYRTDELLAAAQHLQESDWDIENELPEDIPDRNMLYIPASLLKSLYAKIRSVAAAELKAAQRTIKDIVSMTGPLTEDNILSAVNAIKDLIDEFAKSGIRWTNPVLRNRYEGMTPQSVAEDILHSAAAFQQDSRSSSYVLQLVSYSRENPLGRLAAYRGDFSEFSAMAIRETPPASQTGAANADPVLEANRRSVLSELNKLADRFGQLEVNS